MAEMAMNAAAEAAAETAGDAAAAEVVAPQGETAQEQPAQQAAEGAGSVPTESGKRGPVQNRDTNSQMAGIRRKAEAYDGVSSGIMNLARAQGLQPKDAAEAVEMLEAKASGKSLEEHRRERADADAELAAQVREHSLYKEMAYRAAQNEADAEAYRTAESMRRDLAAIQAVDPSVQSLEELGEAYTELFKSGVSGLNAYYAIKGREAVEKAAIPPSTGPVGRADNPERDYTSEELDRLSDKDLDDPSVFEKALRSLSKLRK